MLDKQAVLVKLRNALTRDPTIRSRVIHLIAIALLPLIALFVWLSSDYAEVQRRVIEVQRFGAVKNLSLLADREVAGIEGILLGLASSEDLAQGNFVEFASQAKSVTSHPNFLAVSVFSSDGNTVFSTVERAGPDESVRQDADTVARTFGGQTTVSGITFSQRLNEQFFSVTVPVYRQGTIVTGLVADMRPAYMSSLFNEAGLKNQWVAAIVDRSGRFVARSLNPHEYVGHLARPELGVVARGIETTGEFDNVTHEGLAVVNSFQQSLQTGWTAVVAVPQDVLAAPFKEAMEFVFFGAAFVSLLSLGTAWLMASRISEPIRRLSQAATALVEGRALPDTPHRISELTEVRSAFEHAVAKSAHLAAIVASSGDAIVSIDADAKVQSWNEGAEKLFGYTPGEILGLPISRIIPANRMAEFETQLATVAAGTSLRAETARQNKDGKEINVSLDMAPIRNSNGAITAMSSIMHDVTHRIQAEKHQRFLMREISHRSKNLLAIVQSMARQTARSASSLSQFETQYMQRLQGLSASHDLLVNENWVGVSLEDLILRQVHTFVEIEKHNLTVSGPKVIVTAKAAQALGLALHELGTNSIKYGALSSPKGHVAVEWHYQETADQPRCVKIQWSESGGPPVSPPTRKGFGHFVMDRMIAQTLDAEVSLQFLPAGLLWVLVVAASHLENEPDQHSIGALDAVV